MVMSQCYVIHFMTLFVQVLGCFFVILSHFNLLIPDSKIPKLYSSIPFNTFHFWDHEMFYLISCSYPRQLRNLRNSKLTISNYGHNKIMLENYAFYLFIIFFGVKLVVDLGMRIWGTKLVGLGPSKNRLTWGCTLKANIFGIYLFIFICKTLLKNKIK